uniref:Cell cycle regulator Mat89Bb n=1 Tax=Panagrellus redivivus TaxID=6233 RepID=A0A7E4V3K2_PANRE
MVLVGFKEGNVDFSKSTKITASQACTQSHFRYGNAQRVNARANLCFHSVCTFDCLSRTPISASSMLIEDAFTQDFYNKVRYGHSIVLVHADVDAVCASMILAYAFGCDNASFTLVPVDSKATIEKAFADYGGVSANINIIMINCGGHISIIECEGLAENAIVYIIDSRRPFHVDNVYSTSVKILARSAEVESWNLPAFAAIYADSDSEDSDDDERSIGSARYQERLAKRRGKVEWQQKRSELLFNYESKHWFALPSSVFMLELVHSLGKSNARTTWLAAVGLNSYFANWTMSIETYTELSLEHMRSFVSKYNHRGESMRISLEDEIMLPLYSKWTLWESLTHDITFCCANKLWSQQGEYKMKTKLAQLGISLEKCRQPFDTLNSDERNHIFEQLKKDFDTGFVAFFCKLGHTSKISALDFARIMAVRLELPQSKETLCDRFDGAIKLMSEYFDNNGSKTELNAALTSYKLGLTAIKSIVFDAIRSSRIHNNGNFLSLTLDEIHDDVYLNCRHLLHVFMTFAVSGHANNKRKFNKPLIVVFPSVIPGEENARYSTISGCMPYVDLVHDDKRATIIPMAFKRALKEANIESRRDTLDPCVFQIRREDGHRFYNSLDLVLDTSS